MKVIGRSPAELINNLRKLANPIYIKNDTSNDMINGKYMWLKTADKDGWISKSTEAVMDAIEISDYDARKQAERDLNTAMNYYEIEFENDKQERWRFT